MNTNNFKLFLIIILFSNLVITKDKYSLAIIGSGPAGSTAAIHAGRTKIDHIIFEGEKGGQLAKAGTIENWPGTRTIHGADLAKQISEHAQSFGTKFTEGFIKSVDLKNRPFALHLNDDKVIFADSIIIATGAKPTKLGLPGESKYLGKGVAICADCDAPLYKNKKVIVIGGDYVALREIDKIKKFTKDITVINKKSELSGPLPLLESVNSIPGIKILNNYEAKEILGNDENVTGVRVLNINDNKEEIIEADGIFISVGRDPATDIFENELDLDAKKRIVVKNGTETSVPGVFAAGDVTNTTKHQALPASSQGHEAALDAEKYLRDLKQNKVV